MVRAYFTVLRAVLTGTDEYKIEDLDQMQEEGNMVSPYRNEKILTHYPHTDAVKRVIPILESSINRWYEEIKLEPDPETRIQQTHRLASVVYVIGIVLHPSTDGNGQISKLIALSYLHDLIPELRSRFFPIKYDSESHHLKYDMGGDFLQAFSGDIPALTTDSEIEQSVIAFAQKVYEATVETAKSIEQLNALELITIAEDLRLSAVAFGKKIQYPEFGSAIPLTSAGSYSDILKIEKAIYEQARKFLVQVGRHNYYEVTHSLPKLHEPNDEISYSLEKLIKSPEGMDFMNNYITKGAATLSSDPYLNKLTKNVLQEFELQQTRIRQKLETQEEHEARHKSKTTSTQ